MKQTQTRAGETRFSIYREDGSIALWPWAWVVSETRQRNYTPDTVSTRLSHITILELWAIHRGIDLYTIMLDGECLSLEQVADLNYFLNFQIQDLRKLAWVLPLNEQKFLTRCLEERSVQAGTIIQRQIGIEEYLQWLGEYGNRLLRKKPSPVSKQKLCRRKQLLEPAIKLSDGGYHTVPGSYAHYFRKLRKGMPQSRIKAYDHEKAADRFSLWLAICNPCEVWPKNRIRALRNYLILLMFSDLGLRAGELGQMKTEDYKSEDDLIEVVRRHNDPEDPRKRQPNAKTFDRKISLKSSPLLIETLDEWMDVRDDIDFQSGRNSNSFMFVNLARDPTEYGKPMSKTAIDDVFRDASRAAGVRKLTPHPMRHRKAREIARLLNERGASGEEARKVFTYHFGWSGTSQMISRYLGGESDIGAAKSIRTIWAEQEARAAAKDTEFLNIIGSETSEYISLLDHREKVAEEAARKKKGKK